MRRMVRGIEKFRRVRRSRRRRPVSPITRDSEDNPPGLNPSSDDDCHSLGRHDSDDNDVDDLFPNDCSTAMASSSMGEPLGNSSECKEGLPSLGSPLQELVPNARNQRDTLRPSMIEETAIAVCGIAFNSCSEFDHHPPFGSVGRLFSGTDEGSCRGTLSTPRERHPLQAETRDQCDRALNGISMLHEIRRSGISAVQKPDEWVLIDVTVDSGACVTVMPSALCTGIPILANDLSKNGVEYEVANGESIANLGERQCQVMTIGSMTPKRIVFQVADVHKPLLSITACSDMGYDCYLGKEGGSLRDRVTGEVIPLERRGSLYSLRMWVRQDPGVNSNSSFAWPE